MIDVDHGIGRIGAAAGAGGQIGRFPREAEVVGKTEQHVVAGGGLLGVFVSPGLVGDQELGQHSSGAHHLRGGGLDDHAVLARTHACRAERPPARVDDAHPAHAHWVVALVVTQHGDVDPDLLGCVEDRRSLGSRDRVAVNFQGDGPDGGCHLLHRSDGS